MHRFVDYCQLRLQRLFYSILVRKSYSSFSLKKKIEEKRREEKRREKKKRDEKKIE
jgi:hypothetical protein